MSSSSSIEREIDEYQDDSSRSEGSEDSVDSSSCSDSSNEHYLSGVPGIPSEEFQELQRKMASGSGANSSRQPSSPHQDEEEDEEDIIYSCAPEVASTLDTAKLKTLVDRYQIPKKVNPLLPKAGEWCCSPSSSLGVYTSYLLASLRFPLNSFCRDLFQRLGIGPNQLNSNGWRTIVAMQVLWREALEGNRPITVDEFLYCYKPSEIKKSASFYQFLSRGSYYSLIKGRSSFDRLWKKEFFVISGNWDGDPANVGSPPFPPFTSPLGRLHPKGMFSFHFISFLLTFFLSFNRLTLSLGDATVVRPRLDKFYLDRIDVVRTFLGRTFHDLVTFSRLAAWGLGPVHTAENLSHEETTRRSKYRPLYFISLYLFFSFFLFKLISSSQG